MFFYPMLRQTMTISFMCVTFASNFSPLAYADVGFVSIRTGSDNISWVYWSQSQKTVNIPNTGGYLRHTYNRPTHDAVKPYWGLVLPMFFNDWATSMPSLVIQPSTATMSDTKEGKRHFTITSLPSITNSSLTRVSYSWLTTKSWNASCRSGYLVKP